MSEEGNGISGDVNAPANQVQVGSLMHGSASKAHCVFVTGRWIRLPYV